MHTTFSSPTHQVDSESFEYEERGGNLEERGEEEEEERLGAGARQRVG